MDEPLSVEVFNSEGSFDQAYTYHADHLGSIRFITDSVGEIVNAYDYDSYGRPGFTVEAIDQPFRYTGREFDQATELYHYRARQYDPETGRFLQEDPLGMLIGMEDNVRYIYPNPNFDEILNALITQTFLAFGPEFNLSFYRYVDNNPLNLIDPSGHFGLGFVASRAKNAAVRTKSFVTAYTRAARVLLKRKARQFLRDETTSDKDVISECAKGILGAFAEPITGIDVDRSSLASTICSGVTLLFVLVGQKLY